MPLRPCIYVRTMRELEAFNRWSRTEGSGHTIGSTQENLDVNRGWYLVPRDDCINAWGARGLEYRHPPVPGTYLVNSLAHLRAIKARGL